MAPTQLKLYLTTSSTMSGSMKRNASAWAATLVDPQGRVNTVFTAPEDFGEVHEIYAVVDGQDVGRGGFRILRSATITPTEGPVGTPITITVKGLSWRGFEHFMALRYDNKYTGEISGVTTNGTAVFQIRAAGPIGKHIIQLNNSTATAPGAYLNTQQSPQDYIYAHLDNKQEFRFVFNVTKDAGPPPDSLQWPDSERVARLNSHAPRTAMSTKPAPSSVATLNPASGPILSKTSLRASGLPPNTEVGLFFVTARGNRMGPSGWNLESVPLSTATTKSDGSLTTNIQIPDDLGGWHAVKLAARDQVLTGDPLLCRAEPGGSEAKTREGRGDFYHTDQRRRLDRVGQHSRRDLRQRSHRLRLRF